MTGYIGPYEYDIYMNDINWIELILLLIINNNAK